MEFQSLVSLSEVRRILSWDELVEFQRVSKQTVLSLSKYSSFDANFLDGDFEAVTIDR